MNDDTEQYPGPMTTEGLVDARQASFAMRLPYYWFSDRSMRSAKRIPHYLLGGLIRFRISELSAWATRTSAQQAEQAAQ